MASNPIQRKWTVEEYLQYEQDTQMRYEYIDGDIYAMSDSTENHSLIKMNIGFELIRQLREKPCRVYDSDMRVKVSDTKYLYPDLSVVCGDSSFADVNRTMLTNPTLIVEVVSPSSEDYDKGTKFDFYREFPSLQVYLILDQSRVYAGLYTQQNKGWLLQEFKGHDAVISLDMIGCELSLGDVYLDIVFDNKS